MFDSTIAATNQEECMHYRSIGIRGAALGLVVGLMWVVACTPQQTATKPTQEQQAEPAKPETTTPPPAEETQPPTPEVVGNYNVTVYRGVDAKGNGRATLSPSQFRFNPDLSTFDAPGHAPVLKPCNYSLMVTGVPNQPAQPNDTGTVAGVPGNFVATFDNNPAGHWSIASQPDAGAIFSTYAQANRGQIVNGTQQNCN
jgi:hypothetical protein